jgi:hypothetical protein
MKNNINSMRKLIASLLIMSGLVNAAISFAGVKEGGGGDSVAFEFTQIAQSWDHFFLSFKEKSELPFDRDSFHQNVSKVLVRSEEHIYLNGEVDATNEPGRIDVSRSRWNAISIDAKFNLVLHEYLGTLDLDRHYELSGPLVRKFGARVRDEIVIYVGPSGKHDTFHIYNTCDQIKNVFSPSSRYSKVLEDNHSDIGFLKIIIEAPSCSQKTPVICECKCPDGYAAYSFELDNQFLVNSLNTQTINSIYCIHSKDGL